LARSRQVGPRGRQSLRRHGRRNAALSDDRRHRRLDGGLGLVWTEGGRLSIGLGSNDRCLDLSGKHSRLILHRNRSGGASGSGDQRDP
jgi:hypothetical protein